MRLNRMKGRWTGALLIVVGVLLALGTAAAALVPLVLAPAAEPRALAASGEGTDDERALQARLAVEALGLRVAPPALDVDAPAQAEGALPLETPRVERDVVLDEAGLRLEAHLGAGGVGGRDGAAATQSAGAPALTGAGLEAVAAPAALAAAAFTGAGVLAYYWAGVKTWLFRALVLPVFPLYARVTRAQVFDNGVRERVFAAVRATPGIAASDISRVVGVSWGTTMYHLDVLEQTRMVTSIRNGRHRRYFENGAALPTSKETVAVLHNAVTADVVATVRASPGATQKELAEALGMSPQALHWHLARLVRAGLVLKRREGRVVRHFLA